MTLRAMILAEPALIFFRTLSDAFGSTSAVDGLANGNDLVGVAATSYVGESPASTAIDPGGEYSGVASSGGAPGAGALWYVLRDGAGVVVQILAEDLGNELYADGATLTISGAAIGGVSPADDLTFTLRFSPSLPTFGAPGPFPGETTALFDGVDDVLVSLAPLALPASWTIEYLSSLPPGPIDGRVVLHIGAGLGDYRPLIFQPRDGVGASRTVVSTNGDQAIAPYALPETIWNHVTITFAQTAPDVGDLTIYANGAPVHSVVGFFCEAANDLLHVAQIANFFADLFRGSMGYIAVYNAALAPATVLAHFDEFVSDSTPPMPPSPPDTLTPADALAAMAPKYKTVYAGETVSRPRA